MASFASLESSSSVVSGAIQDDELFQIFALLKTIRDYHRSHFPFLKNRLDFELLIFIGYRQARGAPMNLTEILAISLSSVSTVVRHLGRFERLGVITKRKGAGDKRNVRYFLADAHFEMMRGLTKHLTQSEMPEGLLAQCERAAHQC